MHISASYRSIAMSTDDSGKSGIDKSIDSGNYEPPAFTSVGSFRSRTRGINGTWWEPQPLTWGNN
ncbi:lasso RiPP family leader peptide-containing protein [Nocardia sp. NBC_00416]|uniref:lasso RiPP family leader peptide-containing protein n=1 Tax=Nocardia sp. NBC_00416 TaxID=2975991 RepID=UPI003FA5C644